jgi:methionyl-tRNA synthetase
VHGFLNAAGGLKMSKSKGTSVTARDYLERVKHPQAAEFLRFYFGSKLSNNAGDIDLNIDEFVNRVNTTLSNNIGNLHHRTVVFCDRFFNSEIPNAPWDEAIAATVEKEGALIAEEFGRVEYRSVIERIQALGALGNKYYQDSKPWELIKSDLAAAATVMVTCANLVRSLAVFLKPVVPDFSAKVEVQFGGAFSWQDHVFSLRKVKLGKTEKLVLPIELETLNALFPLAQPEAVEAASQKTGIDVAAFKALDLRVGVVKQAEKIEKSEKLLKLQVDIGGETRQIVAGIAQSYSPESMMGKQVVMIANLKPAKVMGVKSEGMLLAAHDNGALMVVQPDKPVAPGSKVS